MSVTRVLKHIWLLLMLTGLALAMPAGASGVFTLIETHKDGTLDGLALATSVAVSPDGNYVYVTAESDNSVAVFSRNGAGGELSFVELQRDGVGGVDGLAGAQSIAISPDGKHVYVAGPHDDAVAVFSCNTITGTLTFVEFKQDGAGGVDGLDSAYSVAISPDGQHVYAASEIDDAIAVFSRNTTTGALTFVEFQKDGISGVDGLDGARSVTVSPDGAHVYATGVFDDALVAFSRNETTGALTFVEREKDGSGGVNGLDGARSVTVSPDGKHVYATSVVDSAIAGFSRNATTGALTYVELKLDGVGNVDGLGFAVSATFSPDGQFLYVAGANDDALAVFSRNATTGVLTFVEMKQDSVGGVDGLDGANSVAVSPDGEHLYAAGRAEDAVAAFSRNATTGALTFIEMQQDGAGVDGLSGAAWTTISADGKHVYVAGSGDSAVALFSRDTTTGALTYVEIQRDSFNGVDGLWGASSVALSPDGKHLYATGGQDDAVTVFSRNAMTGTLTFVEFQQDGVGGVDGLDGAEMVTVSPDGKHVYAIGPNDNAVAVFSRNAATGALTFVEMKQDGVGGVDGLRTALWVAVSPDGKHVYTTGGDEDAVALFNRNATTGALTFVEIQQDGVGGVDGLDHARAVTVSPDGKHVYATGEADDALVVFSRNATTGVLTFVEAHKYSDGVDGLDGAYTVLVSPDGTRVFVTAETSDTAAVFTRNASSGALTFVAVQHDGIGGVDGLDGARGLAVSPDGQYAYVTGFIDDALTAFKISHVVYLPLVLKN